MKHLNAYDKALIEIHRRILTMSELVCASLKEAMDSFVSQDIAKAKAVIDGDEAVDTLEEALEMDSLELIS